MVRLLLVEDDPQLARSLVAGLRHEGYLVDSAQDGRSALAWLAEHDVDVILLDRDVPGVHGDIVCRRLVEQRHPARILMLTAATSLGQIVEGFDLGADDYLTKPFAYVELLARIQALARRSPTRSAPAQPMLERGALRVDLRRQRAECNGLPLGLTPKEFGVLRELLLAEGACLTTTTLLDQVWDDPFDRTPGVVKVVIHGLRQKLGAGVIETVPGFGYRIP